jgi:flagellar basal-body rod protein FlgB
MVTNPAHMNPDAVDLSNVRTVTDRQTASRNDDSNVDIEREMYQLADTTIRFDTMARVVTGRLGWLRTVIEGK